jgi:hypothetical protein
MPAIWSCVSMLIGLIAGAAVANAEPAYFLMSGEGRDGEMASYVIAVDDLQLVQQARAHLRTPPAERPKRAAHIRIAAGADRINRNHADPAAPFWSWHVVELIEWVEVRPVPPAGAKSGLPDYRTMCTLAELPRPNPATPPLFDVTPLSYVLTRELLPNEIGIPTGCFPAPLVEEAYRAGPGDDVPEKGAVMPPNL